MTTTLPWSRLLVSFTAIRNDAANDSSLRNAFDATGDADAARNGISDAASYAASDDVPVVHDAGDANDASQLHGPGWSQS